MTYGRWAALFAAVTTVNGWIAASTAWGPKAIVFTIITGLTAACGVHALFCWIDELADSAMGVEDEECKS